MILQALTELYQVLEQAGKIDPPGWAPAKISYAISLSPDGTLETILPLKIEQKKGEKAAWVPRIVTLPAPVKRASNVAANFLWDNAGYLLGLPDDEQEKHVQRARKSFAAAKDLHEKLLTNVDSDAAKAVIRFFETWNPETSADQLAQITPDDILKDLRKGANLIFCVSAAYVQEDKDVRRAWDEHYGADESGGPQGVCLVTGESGTLVKTHPYIKNVAGASKIGSTLVSFNGPAFSSYGKEQNENAPITKDTAFAYTSALNYLLTDAYYLGDMSVVFWAKNGEDAYRELFGAYAFGLGASEITAEFRSAVESLCCGVPVEYADARLLPETEFYVLGISPNAARLSVRLFLRDTFQGFLLHVQAHYRRMEIICPTFDKREYLSPWAMLNETIPQQCDSKIPAPVLEGELLRAILTNTCYPATLLAGVMMRIQADHQMTRGRAAIIKAYYLKLAEETGRDNPNIPKEVLQMAVNDKTNHLPYTLGRIFSVLEGIQLAATPKIGVTFKDKYLDRAAMTPAMIMPMLVNNVQPALTKLRNTERKRGLAISFDKKLTELFGLIDAVEFPARLSLEQQGSFHLGYYHETQARYQKKEEKSDE